MPTKVDFSFNGNNIGILSKEWLTDILTLKPTGSYDRLSVDLRNNRFICSSSDPWYCYMFEPDFALSGMTLQMECLVEADGPKTLYDLTLTPLKEFPSLELGCGNYSKDIY